MTTTKVDHYAEAERLLNVVIDEDGLPTEGREEHREADARFHGECLAAAHVHALLALTDAQWREADADEIVAPAGDPQDGRRLRIETRA